MEMSDLYAKKEIKVNQEHNICHRNKKIVQESEIVATIHIPYVHLIEWYNTRDRAAPDTDNRSYIQLLNCEIVGIGLIKIDEGCERIEGRLRRIAAEVKAKYKTVKGGVAYQKLGNNTKQLAVLKGEIVSFQQLEADIRALREKNVNLKGSNDILKSRYQQLYSELLQSRIQEETATRNLLAAYVDIEKLRHENSALHQKIEIISNLENCENKSGKMSEVSNRHQYRKLREVKTRVEQALWFAESYGLTLDEVSLIDDIGKPHTISFGEKTKKSYENLPEKEKDKVKDILFILDKFCIGDAAYHELSLSCSGENLPRSYLIKQCKGNLNDLCHIERTPGLASGAQLDFKDELITVLRKYMDKGYAKYRIKISGDGAQMTRMTNFVIISFAILDDESTVMSSKGNHTVAVIKGYESYELLRTSCAKIFKEVNQLASQGKILIDGREIPIEIFLGGDYKFLLLILGMKGATSNYACIWCKVHKDQRGDMTKELAYWEKEEGRTLEDMKTWSLQNLYSCGHLPLLKIPLPNVVLDELHLMLRVTDVLTRNLVLEAVQWDKNDNNGKRPKDRTTKHVDDLIKAVNDCGLTFNVWEKTNADGQGSGVHDFTSLMGNDKKLLMKNLPNTLTQTGVLNADIEETVIKIWKDFHEIYNLISTNKGNEEQVLKFFTKANEWIKLFKQLGGRCAGFGRAAITPYMHILVYHVPAFMMRHNGIKKFTGQGVEKNNDDARKIHLTKSNKWDAAKDVLLAGKRQQALVARERIPRSYVKRGQNYWDNGIKETRKKRKRLSLAPAVVEESNDDGIHPVDVHSLSAAEIRVKLREKGIHTRVRSIKKLQQMLLNTED